MNSSPGNIYKQLSQQNNTIQKSQATILQFNKNGLQLLTNQKTYPQAHEYFKKAQRTVLQYLKSQPTNKKANQLAAITYNNLACYYKKTNKPKVALSYLKKALQIQVFKVQDWLSTASTHLNICAIYSFMKKHEQACEHATLAIKMLQKWSGQEQEQKDKGNKRQQQQKVYLNIKMLSHYNSAVQNEYVKKFQQAQKYYQTTKQLASKNQKKNQTLIKTCQQGIQRVKQQHKLSNHKLAQIITRRKQQQLRNNYEFMRKNKKNYSKESDGWRELIHNRKYAEYKLQNQHRSTNHAQTKKNQSLGKLISIKPTLHVDVTSKSNLHSVTGAVDKKPDL